VAAHSKSSAARDGKRAGGIGHTVKKVASAPTALFSAGPNPFLFSSGDLKESSAWGVGGRIGYLVTPNVFTYWNGGFTETRFDQINFSNFFPGAGGSFSIGAHTYDGWFIGGGTEISLSGLFGLPLPAGLFWRSEYRFASYNGATLPVFAASVPFPGAAENFKPYVQTIVTALVYRFNWYGH
jgi:outer membrane immunogenic protein